MKAIRDDGTINFGDVDIQGISKKNNDLMENYVLTEGYSQEYDKSLARESSTSLLTFPLADKDILGAAEIKNIRKSYSQWLSPEVVNPPLRRGYSETRSLDEFDFTQPFQVEEAFFLSGSGIEMNAASPDFLRYGHYLVGDDGELYNLQDMVSASLFQKYLNGEDVEREFCLEEVVDVLYQGGDRIFGGMVRGKRIDSEDLRMSRKAGSNYLTTFTTCFLQDETITPSFSLSFYLPEKKDAIEMLIEKARNVYWSSISFIDD